MQTVIESIGWIGSALILVSLAQGQPRRLHRLNNVACIVLVVYNALIGAVPGIGLNVGLILVNLWRLGAIAREQEIGNTSRTNTSLTAQATDLSDSPQGTTSMGSSGGAG